MLQANTDTFGVSLDVGSDAVLNELQNSATTEQDKLVLNDILVQLLEGVICVMKKQLHDYLEGTLTNLSPSIVHQASSAQSTICMLNTPLAWLATFIEKLLTSK